jgi:hypothetical protein
MLLIYLTSISEKIQMRRYFSQHEGLEKVEFVVTVECLQKLAVISQFSKSHF